MTYQCPLEEMQHLIIRQMILKEKYNITNSDIYDMEYRIKEREREFKMRKHDMNKDIQEFDIYVLTRSGKLKQIFWIKSTNDYNHHLFNLHHFIEKQHYRDNEQWYKERGIKQKLILLPVFIHEQVHGIAIKNLSDEEFKSRYKISKWDLLFNRKFSEY